MAKHKRRESVSRYVSARELSDRWQCSRSSVDRIARRAGLTRLHLGEGKNGMVRYLRKEVVALEESLLKATSRKATAAERRRLL